MATVQDDLAVLERMRGFGLVTESEYETVRSELMAEIELEIDLTDPEPAPVPVPVPVETHPGDPAGRHTRGSGKVDSNFWILIVLAGTLLGALTFFATVGI